MKVSVQLLLTLRETQTHPDPEVYTHALAESRLADALGFEAIFMGTFSRGMVDGSQVLHSMRLFGEKVMPSL